MAHDMMIAANLPTHIAPTIEKINDVLHEHEREKDEPSAHNEESHGVPPPRQGTSRLQPQVQPVPNVRKNYGPNQA
jgi:hypothetical protein